MNKGHFYSTVVLIATLMSVYGAEAPGASRTWNGSFDNDWFTGVNWTPAGTPANSDDLTVSSGMPHAGSLVRCEGGGSILVQNASAHAFFAGMIIGSTGTGVLEIQSAGEVSSGYAVLGDKLGGGSGSALVTGGDSKWTLTGSLTVGDDQSGNLTISDGGLVSCSFAEIGGGLMVMNAWANVTGVDSEWRVNTAMHIGGTGTGKLTVGGGGKVTVDSTLSLGSRGTIDLNNGGLLMTNYLSLASGAVFNSAVGSLLRANVLGGFGNTINLGGDLYMGNSGGLNPGSHVVSAGQTFNVCEQIIGYDAQAVFEQTGGAVTADHEILGYAGNGTYNQSGGTHQIATHLHIAHGFGSVGQYNLSDGSLTVGTSEIVGRGNAPGSFVQTGGTHTVGSDLYLGQLPGPMGGGTYNLSGAPSQLTVTNEYIGYGNTGAFTQSDGTHQVNDVLYLGYQAGGTGTYNFSEGTLIVNTEYVGYNGTGIFNQTGGSHHVTGGATLYLGYAAGSSGSYTLDGGNLTTSQVKIAEEGSGTFIQNGGIHSVTGAMYVGHVNDAPEIGRYELHGGTLYVGSNEYVGDYGAGEFLQTDGAHTVQENLYVGTYDPAIGSYEMSGGTLDVTGTSTVGAYSVGVFTHSGGTHSVNENLVVGDGAMVGIGSGTYILSGSGTLDSRSDVLIGTGDAEMLVVGVGLFDQAGGTHTVTGDLHVGHHQKGVVNGVYNLGGGTLDVGDHVYVGYEGIGEFNQSGAAQLTTGQIVLGDKAAATGTFNLDGGTLTASISECIAGYGTGEFNQTGGVNDIGISMTLGAGAGGVGTYNLDGGTLSVDYVYVGSYGTGHFIQTAGTHTVGETLQIGPVNYQGASGTYDLQGGDLSVTDEDVGEDGIGAFTQSGGTHTVSGQLTVSTDPGADGSYELSGGDLSVGTEYVGYQDAASFVQTGGTHTVIGDLYMAHGWNPSITTYALGPAGTLSVGGNEYVGYWSAAEFTQTGGTHEVTGDLTVSYEVDGFCSYDLSGAASVLTVGGDERIGYITPGSFTQSAGTHTVAGTLALGNSGEESGPTYNLSGGTLQADAEIVGKSGQSVFTQTGGTNTVTKTLTIVDLGGEEVWAQGTYNLDGGALTAGTVDNNDTVNQSGGTLDTGTFNNAGTFNQTGGTMTAGTFNNPSFPTTYVYDPAVFQADTVNNNSDFYQYGGTVRGASALMGRFNNTGGFFMFGGTFEDRLVNEAFVSYFGGTFNGIYEHWNNAMFERAADFTAEGGIINYGELTSRVGQQLNANGPGIQNYGQFYLNGGTCGATTFTNDFGARFEGYGTLDADLVNNGTLETDGMLMVTGTTTNMGQVRIESAEHLRPDGGMTSTGIVEMEGGSIGGAGALVNQTGGVIRGFGGVSAPTTNDGGVIHATGTQLTFTNLSGGNVNGGELRVADGSRLQIVTPFASSGTIVTEGPDAALLGGTISNTGTLSGSGRVSNIFLNDGVVRAAGGALTLSGAGNTNTGLGRIEVQDGASVVMSQGLSVNAGTIALTGGTFDNNARAMTNTGSILGRGTIATGGLTNDGLMAFADGDTDIFGDVTNNHTLNVTECATTFFGDVTNAPGATIKNTDGTVRFLGDFVNNGTYSSDPADNYFVDITVGTSGSFIGGAGDRFLIAGDFDNASAASTVWGTTEAELVFLASAHTLELPGADMGTTYAGMDDNFAWGILRLAESGSLTLADGNAVSGGAMYVTSLILEGGLSQIGSIADNGFSIYYDPASSDNDYLDAKTFPMPGGGKIAPIPEPATLILIAGGLPLLLRRKRKSSR